MKPTARLQPTCAFSPEVQFKMLLEHKCAYDPETGVFMSQGNKNHRRYVVVFAEWTQRYWRIFMYADNVEEAIDIANARLAKAKPEHITIKPNPKFAD